MALAEDQISELPFLMQIATFLLISLKLFALVHFPPKFGAAIENLGVAITIAAAATMIANKRLLGKG
jgi:hypothetical protein